MWSNPQEIADSVTFAEEILKVTIKAFFTNIIRCSYLMFLAEKDWHSQNLLEKCTRRNALALTSKKVQGIFGETFILAFLSSAVFRLQNRVSAFF